MPSLNARPEPVGITLDRTAVIVVDMQNAFVSKGGMFDLAGFDISGAACAIAAQMRSTSACVACRNLRCASRACVASVRASWMERRSLSSSAIRKPF